MTLDAKHERVLCDAHANGVRDALALPGTYRVTWGLSTAEKIAKERARVEELIALYGEPPPETNPEAPIDWADTDWDDGSDSRPATAEEEGWFQVWMARSMFAQLSDEPYREPVVRVRVQTL